MKGKVEEKQKFKTVISSKHRVFDLHIRETLKYRDLIFLFVKRDFVSQYKQTILGPLWAILQPLLTTVVFTLIFGSLAGLPKADIGGVAIPSFLFYLSGTLCWQYFSGTFSATSNTFRANAGTMGKVYYPRLVAPISTAFSHLVSFGIQFMMFVAFWIYYLIVGGYSMGISVNLLFLPLIILQLMVLSVGFGIIISAFTTKYKDLGMLVGFGLQLWQYATPVAYGLQLVQERIPNLMSLYMLNPVTSIVTTFRYAMFGVGYFNIMYYLIGWGVSFLVFFIGLILFSRIERSFMDTI